MVKALTSSTSRVRQRGPVVQPGMLTHMGFRPKNVRFANRFWSRDRKVAGSNPARSTIPEYSWDDLLLELGKAKMSIWDRMGIGAGSVVLNIGYGRPEDLVALSELVGASGIVYGIE